MMTVEVLDKAREQIARPGGWCQGLPRDGAVCAVIALAKAGKGYHREPIRLLRKAIRRHGVAEWNDKPGRRQATVVRAFDRAIALARTASRPHDATDPAEAAS